MFVVKRDGTKVPMRYDSITDRNVEHGKDLSVDVAYLSQLVISGLKSGMTTSQIDDLSSETAAYLSCYNPDYDTLATRIAVSNLHKSTKSNFADVVADCYNAVNPKSGKKTTILSSEFYTFVQSFKSELQSMIDFSRDWYYTYFGFQTMKKLYLLKLNGKIVERPQHMWLRVSVAIHMEPNPSPAVFAKIKATYDAMSNHLFTHASPTLFNAGSPIGNLSSCFLLHMDDDINHIFTTNHRCAKISKLGGGIGIDISKVRAKGSTIHSTNGTSDGIVPMVQVFNATARYINQSGRRSGSIAMYLEPSHPDILEFLALRLPSPPDELRARDIFLALWVSDLFMKRVKNNETWSLFCPSVVPQLNDVYGEEYEKVYLEAEQKGLYSKQIPAQDILKAICQSQQETGLPYILYKDSINRKSNQKNIGLIRSSNLCAEIVEYTSPESVAVCNLSSIALHKFVNSDRTINFDGLGKVVEIAVTNLNKVIDRTYYPVDEGKTNNLDFRPIGLGVQGLADVFALCKTSWGSEFATKLNRVLFEVIYFYACNCSADLAAEQGSYSSFQGSPVSEGKLQYHLWDTTPLTENPTDSWMPKLDWQGLIEKCKKGMRNSLLIALMPTASSSQILGSNECFEPFTSNIYTRSTNSGEFIVVNKYLYRDLKELGLWDKSLVDQIIANNGSVQAIISIPEEIRERYKTVWEISQKIIIDYAADRAPFVDQTQSMNLFLERPTHAKCSSMMMYGWEKGLKTGSYYIRSKPATNAVKFTIQDKAQTQPEPTDKSDKKRKFVCVGEEGCLSCSA
jgi:ribonucleoside-diphosphate reductase alpha subunit